MSEILDDAASKHTIPVIDRMMDVLDALEHHPQGFSIRELTDRLGLPRTTVYRILNTLERHAVVRRGDGNAYRLGQRLLSLAAQVGAGADGFDLKALAQPFLDRLAGEVEEGVKLSVVDRDGVSVVATAAGRREYALAVSPGQRLPVHAGAASKLLLAFLPAEQREHWLAQPLVAFTSRTITDPKRLATELGRIRRLGWAQDKGENAPSIQAFAAPVLTRGNRIVAAVSVPFLAGTEPSRMEQIRLATIATARALSASLPE